MTDKIVVFSTCSSSADAEKIARHLVETRVAACVSILPAARSIYRWQGKIEDAAEHVLLIKSSRGLFPALRDELRKTHPYEVPEIIAVPVVDGSEEYLQWLGAEVRE
ncbi:MAG TPA: divalent-cation tolerance protein CutA [Bryobacteraceae bacterium]|nr:divalent-cation tolerance protein CutA [Bryobacteraceae bacterium]